MGIDAGLLFNQHEQRNVEMKRGEMKRIPSMIMHIHRTTVIEGEG